MDHIIRIGMDTSKNVFQLHGVNAAEDMVLRRKLRRREKIKFFQKLSPVVIATEAQDRGDLLRAPAAEKIDQVGRDQIRCAVRV